MNLNQDEFGRLFKAFRESAFRLETLQVYTVPGEAEELEAWREGRGLPERSMRTSSWLQNVARTTAQGKRWTRVHLVRHPTTEYLEFELVGLEANVAAGEAVRIVLLNDHPELTALTEDFWAFDLDTDQAVVVWMRYDSDGRLLGFDRSEDPQDILRCRRERDMAIAASVPLYEYRAMTSAMPVEP